MAALPRGPCLPPSPPLIPLQLLTFTSSKRIMGYMVNSWPMMVVAWLIAIVCMSINGYLVVSQLEVLAKLCGTSDCASSVFGTAAAAPQRRF